MVAPDEGSGGEPERSVSPQDGALRLPAKGHAMHKSVVIAALSGAILFAVAARAADQAAKPTDPQIVHIAYTAGKIDIEAAQQALNKSKNKGVHAFAQRMIGDHTAINDQALALAKRLNVTPEDNPTSQNLTQEAEAAATCLLYTSDAADDLLCVD